MASDWDLPYRAAMKSAMEVMFSCLLIITIFCSTQGANTNNSTGPR